MDSAQSLTDKEDIKNGHSNSHSAFLSSLSYSDSEKELEIELDQGATVSGPELRAILDKQLVYVSGGLEEDRRPILTFPEVGLRCLENPDGFKELATTLLYFKTLSCFTGLSAGISLLVDARNTKTHGPVKQLLDKLVSKEIALDVHVVYVYMKSRIFGRGKLLTGPEVAAKLQIKYLYDQKGLLDQLEGSNVTTDLGGTLSYDHKNWVQNRLDYENVRQMHDKTIARYPKFAEALDHGKLPSRVKEAEQLMQADSKLKESFESKLAEALLSSQKFLEALRKQQPEASMQIGLDTKEHIKMMASLKGLHQDLKEKQDQLNTFWLAHKARMGQLMHMCHLYEKIEEMQNVVRGYVENVNKEGSILGDTLETALEYGEKFDELVAKYKTTLDESMEGIDEDVHVLINPDSESVPGEEGKMHSAMLQAIESVKTQVEELRKSYKELTDLCQQKRDTFVLCMKFHMMTRQVQQWNQDVLEFLATLYLEDMSEEDASANLSKIEGFTSDGIDESQLATVAELASSLPSEKHFKKTAGNIKEKYEQACGLLDVRKSHIMKKLAALRAPDPPPTVVEEKEQAENVEDRGKSPESELEQTSSGSRSQGLPTITTEDTDSPVKVAASSEHTDGESDANVLKSRQFVYKELLATEKVYIDDLKTVLHGYYDAMDPEESTSIPLRLRDKRGIVFGNLPEIYKFHETVFSKALEQYGDHPANIGECFVQHMEEFQMYSVYCKNRSQSEALINESTESQAFFKGIQMNLAHQLSLDSYLLKPVQRITKYQLLLKDMMKHSVKAKAAHSKLKKALDGMLKVLKNLNDSLHVVGLKGFPGALAEQGRLLVHDPFQLWDKSAPGRSLFSRAHERHVFLFEKMVIFSKKTEAASQKKDKKSDNYLYKGHLSMAEIGLRPTIGGQPLQFELSLHGQQKVYILQAQNKEVHDMWTSEIRRLLEAQLVLMKDIVIKSGTLNRRAYKGKAKLSTHARDSRFFAEPAESQSLSIDQIKRQKNGRVKKKRLVPSFVEMSVHETQSLSPNAVFSLKGDEDAMSEDDASDEDDVSISTAMDLYETLAPSAPRHCLAISDYNPGDSDENGISLTESQEVEVIGVNQFGWWWVRATSASSGEMEEGWVPASYLRCQLTHL